MTFLEKDIYNTYIRVSRSKQNLPYKYRKNFDNFADTSNYVYVKKLGKFFTKFSHINVSDFFDAPYEIYPDNDSYDLRFYITPKAVKIYSSYINQKDNEVPDSEHHQQYIKQSLMFIFKYCKSNNIGLDEYMNHRADGDLYTFIQHLRDRSVSVYTLFGFDVFESRLYSYPSSRLEFTLGKNFIKELASRKIGYYNSNKAKTMVDSGLAKIKKLINKLKT